MSWSISIDAHANDVHDVLLEKLAEAEADDAALVEAAINAAMPLLSLIGDPSVDEVVSISLGGNEEQVSISVVRVVGTGAEPNPNDVGGGVPDSTPPPEPTEAELNAEPATPDAEAPYDPAEFKASEFADGSLETYSVEELDAIRTAEVEGKNRVTVLEAIDNAIAAKSGSTEET